MAAIRYFPSIHDDNKAEKKDMWHCFEVKLKRLSSAARKNRVAAAAEASSVKAGADTTKTGSDDAQQLQASSPAASTTTTTTTRWGCLVPPEYQPLNAFSATAAEDPGSTSQSEDDEMCELLIRMKELELLSIIGETPFIPQCKRQ